MAAPLIPWEPCNIPEEIQEELNRRKTVRSFDYVNWDYGDPDRYKGPMTPWIRCCSNGRGKEKGPDANKHGFIFYGGKDFYKGYGFQGTPENPSVIGYIPDGRNTPHIIHNDWSAEYPIHVPPPEIEKIDVVIQKEHYRRLTMEWVCFSKKQLEYMAPYFLVPGISCVVEWGWNHYDPSSLLDLSDTTLLENLFNNPYPLYTKYILQSKGNYDVIFGIVTHFEWSVDQNKIKCKTEITSKDRIYAGLSVDSVSQDKKKNEDEEKVNPFGSLLEFVENNLCEFKYAHTIDAAHKIPNLYDLIKYVTSRHGTGEGWREYIYGVFCGRDKDGPYWKGASKKDFDYKAKHEKLWINLGLIIETINFHSAPLTGMNAKEMFRIDIDDCVIGAHPNMISSDGDVCLIPNGAAPKYFSGAFGATHTKAKNYKPEDWSKLDICTEPMPKILSKEKAKENKMLADFRLRKVCLQGQPARDNLDELINWLRYIRTPEKNPPYYAFPFKSDMPSGTENYYPARFSGYLKNIYINVDHFKSLLKRGDEIKTYYRLIEKLLEDVNSACGNFWDFRIVNATGGFAVKDDEPATMKIVDYKFMYFTNRGKVYTIDYMDADSILMGMDFKPTISNAQAIRSIYAVVNNPDQKNAIVDGTNELLDYRFGDRLTLNKIENPDENIKSKTSQEFIETMRSIQQLDPTEADLQMTCELPPTVGFPNGRIVIRRLVLPRTEILRMLLDDEDEENNPKYTGIMPGIQANFTIQGIGGLRTFMMFLVRNLPEPYSHENIVFRIVNINDSVDSSGWTTVITAGIIPLRDYIKTRLSIEK